MSLPSRLRSLIFRQRGPQDPRRGNWLADALHDFRYAGRTFQRSPGFVLAAVLTLTLGIGANTTVFNIADAVLLRMLPVPEPERLIQILEPKPPPVHSLPDPRLTGDNDRFTFANYQEMKQTATPFADMVAESSPYGPPYATPMVIDGVQEVVRDSAVSGNFFDALGVRPVLGHVMDAAMDNEPGRHPEAVISYGYWKRRFDLDARVIGRAVRIGDTQFQIIGVAEPGFFGLEVGSMIDLWTPAIMEKRDLRRSTFLRVIARLHAGITARQVLAPLQVWYHRSVMARFANAAPDESWYQFARAAQLKAVPAAKGMSPLRTKYVEPIEIVFAVVVVVLLLACANVANLLLARASTREREMAVRKSLGAGRLRLIRQVLTESLLLTAVAATIGALAARWTAPLLVSMLAPSETPVQLALGLDGRVVAFVAALSLLTTIVFGIFPALRASETDIHSALKSGSSAAGASHAWQRPLMALQVALSLVLLVASALFVRTLVNLKTLDAGFDRHNIILAVVQFRGLEKEDRLILAWQELLRRVTAIPGVESASVSTGGPFFPSRRAGETRIANAPWNDNLPISWYLAVSANYFRTFGARLVTGRDFAPPDYEPSGPAVAIVNETMAQRFFGNDNPIGRKLNDFGPKPPPWAEMIEIVGVAADMKYDSLRTAPPSLIYLPLTQRGSGIKLGLDIMTVELRTRTDSGSLTGALRRELSAANPRLVLRNITSQTKLIDDTLIRERLLATVGSFFGIVALLLAGIGLYGTMSYSVSRRTQEIGIRMVLGAGQNHILLMVLREALVTVAAGGVVGVAMAMVTARIVASLLFGVKPQDPTTIVVSVGLLVGTSLVAAFVPALRACRTVPINALRNE